MREWRHQRRQHVGVYFARPWPQEESLWWVSPVQAWTCLLLY